MTRGVPWFSVTVKHNDTPGTARCIETERRRWEPGAGGDPRSSCLTETVSVREGEKVLEMEGGNGCSTV